MQGTIVWQRVEGAVVFLSGLAVLMQLGVPFPIWAAILLFFAPDFAFAGYLLGRRVGAAVYNMLHLYAFGAVVAAIGLLASASVLVALGVLWGMHAGFDRALGYGLKSNEGFTMTHLGSIGPRQAGQQ